MIYDTKSLAITVLPFKGKLIDWSTKWRARQHLAFLLRKDPSVIDLSKAERLPGTWSQERFLLFFRTNDIPRQLFAQSLELSGVGIRLQRHFRDISTQRLTLVIPKRRSKSPRKPIDNLIHSLDK